MNYSDEKDAWVHITEATRICPCGHMSNETISECPECGMSENNLAYYDENGLIPEKPLCFE